MTDNFEAAEAQRQASVYAPEDPHAGDPEEDPEQHLGPILRDPWQDITQTDWADHTIDLDPETMGV